MWGYKMKKLEMEIKLKIKFYNSFFFGGGTGIGEIQSYLLCNANGHPYISGAALKGCIAEYANALLNLVPKYKNQEKLFGIGGVQQGSIYFENANLVKKAEYLELQGNFKELRTGISINPYTRVKKEGHLFTMETSGQGGSMVFESSIYGFLDEETYKEDVACLISSIRLIFALGGRRSAGLGWLETPIECEVFEGERQLGKETQRLIASKEINEWIRKWIGGKGCIK